MSNKRFDFSVLPDGFLIQYLDAMLLHIVNVDHWSLDYLEDGYRQNKSTFRPALNHDHFNDGSMVLPDGLVFIAKDLTGYEFIGVTPYPFEYDLEAPLGSIVGVKIIGAHPDYAEHAKELGIEVVEI